jgi:uncharacterized protein (TIGR02246 family)
MHPDEQAIRDLIALWHRATAAGDVDTVLDLMADDVVFLVAGQPPMQGRAAFERGLRGLLAQHRIESTHAVREVGVDGNLAYSWAARAIRVVPHAGGGAPAARSGSTLSVLRRQADGRWRMVRDANLLGGAAS